MNGIVEQASEQELSDAAARADATGMYTCPHTAVGLAVLEKLRKNDTIKSGEKVVCISTANGLKFTEFKVKYHEESIPDVKASHKNPAVMLPAELGAVVDAIKQRFA